MGRERSTLQWLPTIPTGQMCRLVLLSSRWKWRLKGLIGRRPYCVLRSAFCMFFFSGGSFYVHVHWTYRVA